MKKIILSITVLLSLSGCSGKVYTIINPDLPADGNTTEKKIEGIITYNEVDVIELYKTTILEDKDGNPIGTAKGRQCIPVKTTKLSTRVDYSNPYIIVYEAALFESNTFGVTLEKGVLKTVNTSSSPAAALPNIASIVPFFKAPVDKRTSDYTEQGTPLCNKGLTLIGIYKAPKIQPYRTMPK